VSHDSGKDTEEHIARVQSLLGDVANLLLDRGAFHDRTKLEEPEKSAFDQLRSGLRDVTYGSPEYMASLTRLGDALAHHYQHNAHHPEHHAEGIRGMSLVDIVEMLIDWKAASERHADGDIVASIETSQERFGFSDELKAIFLNTARDLGWIHMAGNAGDLAGEREVGPSLS
jgi:hypothetical protein